MEPAGLAVGGVALVGVFTECVTMFEYVDAGRNCSKEYQQAALKVALLGRRLTAWEESYNQAQPSAGPADAMIVKSALTGIKDCLEEVCSKSERYERPPRGTMSNDESAITDKVKTLTINGKVQTSLGAKIVWALHDKSKLNEVTALISFYLDKLERLSETLVGPIRTRLTQELASLILAASANGSKVDAKSILEENAATVDGDLLNAIEVMASDYQSINVGHEGQAQSGHHVAYGYTDSLGNFVDSKYRDISGGDRAQIFSGNNYGGPMVFTRRQDAQTTSMPEENLRKAVEAFRFDQIDDRHNEIKPAFARTCQWLFESPEYRKWRDRQSISDHHGFLWINGKPGAGKSTLMKCALHDATTRFKDDIIISYFFNARGGLLERTTEGMYRSLLHQLLTKSPRLQSAISTSKFRDLGRKNLSLLQLKDLFREAVAALNQESLTCYIDALDEGEEKEIRDVILFFEELAQTNVSDMIRNARFYVCLSSRHYPVITVERCQNLRLERQEGHEQDINSYVRSQITAGNSRTKLAVGDEIKQRASGVFLWVVLAIAFLKQKSDRGDGQILPKHLDALPEGLYDMFQDIIDRGAQNDACHLLALQWIMCARRRLKPNELYFAIFSDACLEHQVDFDPADVAHGDIEKFLLNSSKGLAEIRRGKEPAVHFIHESVQNYLLETGFTSLDSSLANNLLGLSHDRLKQCCDAYIKSDQVSRLVRSLPPFLPKAKSEEGESLRKWVVATLPFLQYCVDEILYHTDAAHGLGLWQEAYLEVFPLQRWILLSNLLEKHDAQRLAKSVSMATVVEKKGCHHLLSIAMLQNASTVRVVRSEEEAIQSQSQTRHLAAAISSAASRNDSGYASRSNDTATLSAAADPEGDYERETIVSENRTVVVDFELRSRAISTFVGDLVREVGYGHSHQGWHHMHDKDDLQEILKVFALTLSDAGRSRKEKNSAAFLRQHRRRISKKLTTGTISDSSTLQHSLASSSHTMETKQEKMQRYYESIHRDLEPGQEPSSYLTHPLSDANGAGDFPSDISENPSETESEAEVNPVVEETREFVNTSLARQWLVARLRRILQLTCDKGASICTFMRVWNNLKPRARITFTAEWDVSGFLETQYEAGLRQDLRDVITVTESCGYVQATTCAQYMQQTWACSGLAFLNALGLATASSFQAGGPYQVPEGHVAFSRSGDCITVAVDAPKVIAAEIGEQLCWLGSAFRASSAETQRSYYTPSALRTGEATYVITYFEEIPSAVEQPDSSDLCWTLLFRNPSVVRGFPVPRREDQQKGLELPFNLMASLGGAERVTVFDGQLMLKGFSSLLVPVKEVDTSIIWHFIGDSNQREISYNEAFDRSIFPHVSAIDDSCLLRSRHFVGWVSSASVRTGASDINYSRIKYSKAPLPSPGCALERVTVSGGKFVTGGVSFAKGTRDEALCISYEGPYKQELNALRATYVVFFDEQEKRGWLTDGASAVLHLVRAQLAGEPYADSEFYHPDRFQCLDHGSGSKAAYNTLMSNRSLIVDEEEVYSRETTWAEPGKPEQKDKVTTKVWTFEHLVRQIMHIFGQLQSHQEKVKPVHLSGTLREYLEGWSAKEIIQAEKVLKPRVVRLGGSGKGWVDFVRSIDAIVMVGRGFGDLIIPSSPRCCKRWMRVPHGKDYLTATVHTLRAICDKYGDEDETPLRLAGNTYWHQAHRLFELCQCSGPGAHRGCDGDQVAL